MIIELGWTREYIDDCTDMPLINSIMCEWRRYPPVRITVAQFVGYKPPPDAAAAGKSEALEPPEYEP